MTRALSPIACRTSRGRLHAEPESRTRTPFQRDRDRVIHSTAFRRLTYKTQVFVYHEGDHYRTRLTHTLEVAQIARSLARAMGLDDDLAEAIALAHDMGHTPFGHAGEEALDEAMRAHGGFDHNAQTLRILTGLEKRFAGFDGLNLTWEALEGVVKHNGPLIGPHATTKRPLAGAITTYCEAHDLALATFPGAEAQVAAIADDIAYDSSDIDDGLRAGLFDIADVRDVPLAGPAFAAIDAAHPGLERARLIHMGVSEMIGRQVDDVLAESERRIAAMRPASAADVRALKAPVIAMSAAMAEADRALKAFLFRRMYRHYRVNRMTSRARLVVRALFRRLFEEPALLPPEWEEAAGGGGETVRARAVADYIAGMTDRYALTLYAELFDPDSRHITQ